MIRCDMVVAKTATDDDGVSKMTGCGSCETGFRIVDVNSIRALESKFFRFLE